MSAPDDQAKQAHEANKIVRKGLAFAHYKLQYTPFLLEESEDAALAVRVLAGLCEDLQRKIELVEPPPKAPEAEPAKPYVMDLTHVKPKAEASANV